MLVKEDLGQTKADLKKRLKSSAFQVQACDYSYQELLDFNEKLGILFDKSKLREALSTILCK